MLKYILLHFSKTRLLKLHQSAVGCTVYCKERKKNAIRNATLQIVAVE